MSYQWFSNATFTCKDVSSRHLTFSALLRGVVHRTYTPTHSLTHSLDCTGADKPTHHSYYAAAAAAAAAAPPTALRFVWSEKQFARYVFASRNLDAVFSLYNMRI